MRGPFGLQAINPPGVFADRPGEMVAVCDFRLVQVAEIDRPVGTGRQIDGPEPGIARGDGPSEVFRLERRSVSIDLAGDDPPLQRLDAEELAAVLGRQGDVVVNDELVREPRHGVMGHGGEISKRVRDSRAGRASGSP